MLLKQRIFDALKILLLGMVLISAALLSAIATIRLTLKSPEATLPDLVGMEIQEAVKLARGEGIEIRVEEELYSEEREAGQILSQAPAAGSRLKVGQHAYVLVSRGPQKTPIPNLVGMGLRAAELTLLQRGLKSGEIAEVWDSGTEAGQVLAQEPPPEEREASGPTVSLLVSRGKPPEGYLAPNFVGQSIENAKEALERSGLPSAEINFNYRAAPYRKAVDQGPDQGEDEAIEATILSQIPLPGARIGSHTVFVFEVLGPPPTPSHSERARPEALR